MGAAVKYEGVERRRQRRIQVRLPARYRIIGGGGEEATREVRAEALNLSMMGLMLQTDHVETQGLTLLPTHGTDEKRHLELELDLPHRKGVLEATGRVIWVRESKAGDKHKYTAGVLFSYLTEDDQERLRSFIQAQPA